MTTTSQKTTFTQYVLMALLTEQADLAKIPGDKGLTMDARMPSQHWIRYPAARAAIEETMGVLIRALATEHGIPASYPPMG
jgi:hypothetical protein